MGTLTFVVILGIILVYVFIICPVTKKIREEEALEERRREQAIKEAEERKEREEREEKERKEKKAQEARQRHDLLMKTDPQYRQRYEKTQRWIQDMIDYESAKKEEQARRAEEARKQEELKRRKELKDKFHYFTLGGYNAAYRYDYYPRNRYPYVDADQESQRRTVWSFKDGAFSIGVSIASDFLDGNFTKEQLQNMVFCVIPASTQYKNEMRYKAMCSRIAEKFPVRNGFDVITISEDRENSREQKRSNTIANLNFSGSVYGKDVILFDDITTRGTSFIQAANALKEKGARSVYGLFIGRTVPC